MGRTFAFFPKASSTLSTYCLGVTGCRFCKSCSAQNAVSQSVQRVLACMQQQDMDYSMHMTQAFSTAS